MKILVSGRFYPMTMLRFFSAAMKRLGHSVIHVGPYSGDSGAIPWPGQPYFPQYVDKPDIPLPEALSHFPLAAIKSQLPDDLDVIFSFDAGFRLTGRLEGVPTVLYGTDPHALNYSPYYSEYDFFFSAQKQSLETCPGAIWVPLAYDPTVHTCDNPILPEDRPTDVCFIGVMGEGGSRESNAYWQRWNAVQALKATTLNVVAETGLIFKECTYEYSHAKIGLNVSSSWDIPMRWFEHFGYGVCCVTNRLPHLDELGFEEDKHYVAFDTQDEMLEKVNRLLSSGEWQTIAKAGHERAIELGTTYDERVKQMLTHIRLT